MCWKIKTNSRISYTTVALNATIVGGQAISTPIAYVLDIM